MFSIFQTIQPMSLWWLCSTLQRTSCFNMEWYSTILASIWLCLDRISNTLFMGKYWNINILSSLFCFFKPFSYPKLWVIFRPQMKWLLLNANSAIFRYIMVRTSYISMRWWWRPLCTRPTGLIGFLQF
jgi:hypothetical protein